MKTKKLYLIGLDAVPLWLLEELSMKGSLGGFQKLLEKRTISKMESTLPPLTGPAWPSIYTGLKPSEHGVPDFFVMKKDYTPDIVYYDSEENPPFWKALAKKGVKCLVVTPATVITLPKYGNVDMITGFPLPSRANSKQLQVLMKKYDFHGEPDVEVEMKNGKMTEAEALSHYMKSIRSRMAITEDMIGKKDYGLVYVCFTETDRIQHFVAGRKDRDQYLLEIYAELGAFIGRIMKRVDKEDAMLMIVSDHGAQPIDYKFLLNAWLIDNGYITLKDSFNKSPSNEAKLERKEDRKSVRESLIGNYKLRRVYDELPYAMKRTVFKGFGALFPKPAGGEARLHLFDFDMQKTRAFAAISNNPVATIWINDNRFANGIVGKDERDALKKKLSNKLKTLRSANGKRLVVKIVDGDSYYGHTDKFMQPDLLVEARKGYTFDIFNYSSSYFQKPEGAKSGDHLRHGIFGYYPKRFRIDMRRISVVDVAPTIMHYFGIAKTKRSRLVR